MRRAFLSLILAGALAAPAAAQTPPDRAFPIFFEPWSAALDATARQSLGEVAALATQHPSVPLVVTGYADPVGSREANVVLSRLRAIVVADALREGGIAHERIRVEFRGPTAPAFENLESRRVEIRVDRR
jgi:outer membrane protein OmpA-like peptidoglycan-associated protein